ncbi:MAG: TauD/TfdA family dioxygenase, partial [Gammaproteobacteria bacterium]|nr:TauD/TfdA family dioxygenase [Gammaproteobacteria bacterium]
MTLSCTPLTPTIGATIEGVDLRDPLSDATAQEVHAALMRHRVVFFTDQSLSPSQQAARAGQFGRLRVATRSAFEVSDEAKEIAIIEYNRERPPNVNHYHPDGIFRRVPEFAAMLYASEVPQAGGDTLFVNMHAAYEGLSDDLRRYVDAKQASHDFMKLHG